MEFANELLKYKDNRKELIDKMKLIKDINISKITMGDDIAPFSIFALFNYQGIAHHKKINILKSIKNEFKIEVETPKNFEAAAELSPWTGGRMKADWMNFLGDRFVEIFQAGKAAIREVDPRPNVYFDIEIAVSSLWYEQNGIDYHKLMKKLLEIDIKYNRGSFS